MGKEKRKIILIFLIVLLIIPLFAENSHRESESKQSKKAKKGVFFVYPIFFYSPETRIAAGAQLNYIFRGSKNKQSSRPSIITPELIYTQNKQIITEIRTDIYLKDENIHLKSLANYKKFSNMFYGIGIDTPIDQEESYTSRSWEFLFLLEKKIAPGLYIGGKYHFQNWTIIKCKEGGLLSSGDIPGSKKGTLSGIGFVINRDTRNNIFFPTRGELYSSSIFLSNRLFGSNFNFSVFRIDLRKYFPCFSSHVIALQALVETQSGTVPFHMLSKIGGPNLIRGYYAGRYRDKHLLAFQLEYRLPLFWKIGMVVSAGIGEVANRISNFKLENFKYSLGFGFRYLFNKKEHINVRLDMGFGQGTSEFYMDAKEAF